MSIARLSRPDNEWEKKIHGQLPLASESVLSLRLVGEHGEMFKKRFKNWLAKIREPDY